MSRDAWPRRTARRAHQFPFLSCFHLFFFCCCFPFPEPDAKTCAIRPKDRLVPLSPPHLVSFPPCQSIVYRFNCPLLYMYLPTTTTKETFCSFLCAGYAINSVAAAFSHRSLHLSLPKCVQSHFTMMMQMLRICARGKGVMCQGRLPPPPLLFSTSRCLFDPQGTRNGCCAVHTSEYSKFAPALS
jgi:hypothetical protein